MSAPKCTIDRDVMNADTVPLMTNLGLSVFASSCGKNRGAFVLDPPDGHTYSCLNFPENLKELSGVVSEYSVTKSNDITELYVAGNITSSDSLELIDTYVQSVYASTDKVGSDPYACDLGGLAVLRCDKSRGADPLGVGGPVRAAGLAGLFVPALWATGGKELSVEEAGSFYAAEDFEEMAGAGLNAVLVSVPLDAFADGGGDSRDALEELLELVAGSGLRAIISLVASGDEMEAASAVGAAASFAASTPAVLALTVPKNGAAAARAAAGTLPLMVPAAVGDLAALQLNDANVYAALEMPHSSSVADVASSSGPDDRVKLFYHESLSCTARSPLEFSACFRKVPAFVASGFDLSIDDCATKVNNSDWKDYGQCDRFEDTVGSGWWKRHRRSYAARQLFSFERGLGWSFAAWKLHVEETNGTINSAAELYSLRDVMAAGLFPDLTDSASDAAQFACLNPPEADFGLGDDTLTPTAGPPPDCGDGWWNAATSQCDFWVPPVPYPDCSRPVDQSCPFVSRSAAAAAAAGSVGTLIVAFIAFRLVRTKRRAEYIEIPNHNV